MARPRKPKVVSLESVGEVGGRQSRMSVRSSLRVNHYAGLAREELAVIRELAQFTNRQGVVFDMYAHGASVSEIARAMNRKVPTVMQTLTRAVEKAEDVIACKHLGLITTVFEELGPEAGWEMVRELLSRS